MDESERLRYLFKAVLGVDVDEIARSVVAEVAVQRAREVRSHSREWEQYMGDEGGVVFLPRNVMRLGKRSG